MFKKQTTGGNATKRIPSLLLALLLLFTAFLGATGCSIAPAEEDDRLQILCTTFPHYDWLRRIVGDTDSVELTLLIANGTDPHSYEPTLSDIAALSKSDVVVLVGGESDLWVKKALEQAENPQLIQISLMELPGVTLHEITSESGHAHEHEHEHHHGHEHASNLDEHIWLSLSNAMACVEELTQMLATTDIANAEQYEKNAEAYLTELDALNKRYQTAVANASKGELLFADRFPFIYLTEDYGLHVHAAFDGCTTDVSASFSTILRLSDAVEELNVTKIMVTESSDRKLAEAVIRASKKESMEIIALDSFQSINQKRIEAGETYLSVMEQNLLALELALSE